MSSIGGSFGEIGDLGTKHLGPRGRQQATHRAPVVPVVAIREVGIATSILVEVPCVGSGTRRTRPPVAVRTRIVHVTQFVGIVVAGINGTAKWRTIHEHQEKEYL